MKLPWDKQYLKISFHVVFTVLLIYILAGVAGNLSSNGRNIHLQHIKHFLQEKEEQ